MKKSTPIVQIIIQLIHTSSLRAFFQINENIFNVYWNRFQLCLSLTIPIVIVIPFTKKTSQSNYLCRIFVRPNFLGNWKHFFLILIYSPRYMLIHVEVYFRSLSIGFSETKHALICLPETPPYISILYGALQTKF